MIPGHVQFTHPNKLRLIKRDNLLTIRTLGQCFGIAQTVANFWWVATFEIMLDSFGLFEIISDYFFGGLPLK